MTRPRDNEYYEDRTDPARLSQGDIFRFAVSCIEGAAWLGSVPLEVSTQLMRDEDLANRGLPVQGSSAASVQGSSAASAQGTPEAASDEPIFLRLVSLPLTPPAFAMLVTRTSSMRAPGSGSYAHAYRTLVPVVPLAELVSLGTITAQLVAGAQADDELSNGMYLPPNDPQGLPESLALLHSPITVGHSLLLGTERVAQLQKLAVLHLQRQLVRYYVGDWPADSQQFSFPMD